MPLKIQTNSWMFSAIINHLSMTEYICTSINPLVHNFKNCIIIISKVFELNWEFQVLKIDTGCLLWCTGSAGCLNNS
jgi:hypothetical protein